MNGRPPASMLGTRQNAAASIPPSAAPLVALPEVPDPPLLVPPVPVPEVTPLPDVEVFPDVAPLLGVDPTGLLAQPAKRPSRIDEAGVANRRTKRVMVTSVQGWVERANWGLAQSSAPKAGAAPLAHRRGERRPSSRNEAHSDVRPLAPTT